MSTTSAQAPVSHPTPHTIILDPVASWECTAETQPAEPNRSRLRSLLALQLLVKASINELSLLLHEQIPTSPLPDVVQVPIALFVVPPLSSPLQHLVPICPIFGLQARGTLVSIRGAATRLVLPCGIEVGDVVGPMRLVGFLLRFGEGGDLPGGAESGGSGR